MRVFDWLNYSSNNFIWGDSGFHVQRLMIKALLEKKDWHFYLAIPNKREVYDSLLGEFRNYNVTLIPVEYPNGGPSQRFHFPSNIVAESIKSDRYSYDLIYSNLPEIVPSFLQMFNRRSHFAIPCISYTHWLPLPELSQDRHFNHDLLAWMAGALASQACFTNTKYGERIMLDLCSKYLNDNAMDELRSKVRPLYLGTPIYELYQHRPSSEEEIPGLDLDFSKPIVLFNHRMQTYTGHDFFIENMAKLFQKRKDFQVVLTNPSRLPRLVNEYNRKYGDFLILPRRGLGWSLYVKLLWQSDIVAGTHVGTNQWSLSLKEAVACETMPLARRGIFFEEMLGDQENLCFWSDKNEFLSKMNYLLDNQDEMRKIRQRLALRVRKNFAWHRQIDNWIDEMEKAVDEGSVRFSERTEISSTKIPVIQEFIERNRKVSKKELMSYLGWGTNRRWTKYRLVLLEKFHDDPSFDEPSFSIHPPVNRNLASIDRFQDSERFFPSEIPALRPFPDRVQTLIWRVLTDFSNPSEILQECLPEGIDAQSLVGEIREFLVNQVDDESAFETISTLIILFLSNREMQTQLSDYEIEEEDSSFTTRKTTGLDGWI